MLSGMKIRIFRIVIIGTVLLGTVVLFGCSSGKATQVKDADGVVSIPASDLSDETAHFYKYLHNGKEIHFFAVKTGSGSYKAAFDACDSCYKDRKGYEQQGNQMNCKNCNQKFAIDRLGPNATGGCNPGYLPLQMNGGTITILADNLKGGARYF